MPGKAELPGVTMTPRTLVAIPPIVPAIPANTRKAVVAAPADVATAVLVPASAKLLAAKVAFRATTTEEIVL